MNTMNPAVDKLIKLLAEALANQWVKENNLKEKNNVQSMPIR